MGRKRGSSESGYGTNTTIRESVCGDHYRGDNHGYVRLESVCSFVFSEECEDNLSMESNESTNYHKSRLRDFNSNKVM